MPRTTTRARPQAVGSAPRRVRAEKLSISLSADDARWVSGQAQRLGTSVSAVIADAVASERRGHALRRLIERLGGTDDITEEQLRETQAELLGGSR